MWHLYFRNGVFNRNSVKMGLCVQFFCQVIAKHCHFSTFPLCQSIFHQHRPTVSVHLSSFAMPVVAQTFVTFYHATGPLWQDFCCWVTKVIVCPMHLRNSMADALIYLDNTRKMSAKCLLILSVRVCKLILWAKLNSWLITSACNLRVINDNQLRLVLYML